MIGQTHTLQCGDSIELLWVAPRLRRRGVGTFLTVQYPHPLCMTLWKMLLHFGIDWDTLANLCPSVYFPAGNLRKPNIFNFGLFRIKFQMPHIFIKNQSQKYCHFMHEHFQIFQMRLDSEFAKVLVFENFSKVFC